MNNLVKHVQSFFLEVNNVMIFSVIISLITTIIFMKKFYKGSSDCEKVEPKVAHCCHCPQYKREISCGAIKIPAIEQNMDSADNDNNDGASNLSTSTPSAAKVPCSGVIPPTAINVNCVDMKREWRSFRNGFEFYEFASGIRNDDDFFRVANLLTIVGKETFDIFHSMKLSKKQKSTVDSVMNILENYFVHGEQPHNASDDDNDDSEDESDEESNGIYARLKKAKINKLRETLSEEQKQAEKEIEKQQLAAIFELLKRQQEELQLAGEVSEIDLKEQLSLYR